MKMFSRAASMMAVAAALGLAACSGSPEKKGPLNETGAAAAESNESDNGGDNGVSAVIDNGTPAISDAQSKSEPVPNPDELPPADGPPPPQVRDDADASGMTARLPAETDTQPVEGQK